MKAKLITVMFALVLLSGCCAMGGCTSSYWYTNCPTPSTGGASEAAFTDITNTCNGDGCASGYYSSCYTSGCHASSNWY